MIDTCDTCVKVKSMPVACERSAYVTCLESANSAVTSSRFALPNQTGSLYPIPPVLLNCIMMTNIPTEPKCLVLSTYERPPPSYLPICVLNNYDPP